MAQTKKKASSEQKDETHLLRPNGEPRLNPPDFSISLGAKGGTERLLFNNLALMQQIYGD